ncbi:MAG: hypothetical protein HGB11_15675 [Chlorobiales bacterium]|nr:hypothetical protein [Chlorobiales bacterium]
MNLYNDGKISAVQAFKKAINKKAFEDLAIAEMGLIPLVPHLSHFWDKILPHPYEFWMKIDLELVTRCDAVFRFPGSSKGADAECRKAVWRYIPVFKDLYRMKRYLENKMTTNELYLCSTFHHDEDEAIEWLNSKEMTWPIL